MKGRKPPAGSRGECRVYLKKWEKKFPWIAESITSENRALCTWCDKELDVHGSGLRKHEKSSKHRLHASKFAEDKMQQESSRDEQDLDVIKLTDASSDREQAFKEDVSVEKITTVFELDDEMTGVDVSGEEGGCIRMDVSLPVTGHILKDVEVFTENVTLDKCSLIETDLPDSQMCKLYAGSDIATWLQDNLLNSLQTAAGYDVVWQCRDACFRAHKFVLAAFSSHLRDLLPEDESVAIIQTPDLSSEMVKSMLCLVYTGTVTLSWHLLQQINNAFKLVGFCGKDLTAFPYQMASEEASQISLSYDPSAVSLEHEVEQFTSSVISSHQHQIILDDEDMIEFAENLQDFKDEKDLIKLKAEGYGSQDSIDIIEPKNDVLSTEFTSVSSEPSNFNTSRITQNGNQITVIELSSENKKRIRTDKESRVTYATHRKDRGVLSRKLAQDLFDDPLVAQQVRIITACPICFQCFDDRNKMKTHKMECHKADDKGVPAKCSSLILDKNKFKCDKCDQTLQLQHLVFFVKHYKYCGLDDEKASEILRIGDTDEKYVKTTTEKKNSRDLDVLYVMNKSKLMEMSRMLLGRVCEAVWGCRKCYQPFDSELALTNHVNIVHAGKLEHGTCYDHDTKVYTCLNCNIYKTNKSVIYFIYHLARCSVEDQGLVPIDEEEDVDGDTTEEFLDPWGIVNKPLKIESERSKWICESLFGEVYPMLFPCHLCYTVLKQEDDLREHFRMTHPGLENYPEHGAHYDQDKGAFYCPTCKREVCRKQKNSIFFAYHMRKCEGKTYPVTRRCPKCDQSFNAYRAYQIHLQTKCGTSNFVCHICSMELKTMSGLRCHVMYAHSQLRPYPCKVCSKAFKRAADLDHHMKLHMGSLDYSCEKCGKAFPVKKALKNHMKVHFSEAEKPHVCHICGNRFVRKTFLVNHLTTHSTFRGFSCEICHAQVKTKASLQQHRKKVHRLFTPIPDSCILQPDTTTTIMSSVKQLSSRTAAAARRAQQLHTDHQFQILDDGGDLTTDDKQQQLQLLESMAAAGKQQQLLESMAAAGKHLGHEQLQILESVVSVAAAVPASLQVKEEVLPMLGEELELT